MTGVHIAAVQEDWKKKEPPYAGFRVLCTGGCGQRVDPWVNNGSKQCRKCRRKMSAEIQRRARKNARKAKGRE
jgi:hypothetical protein